MGEYYLEARMLIKHTEHLGVMLLLCEITAVAVKPTASYLIRGHFGNIPKRFGVRAMNQHWYTALLEYGKRLIVAFVVDPLAYRLA